MADKPTIKIGGDLKNAKIRRNLSASTGSFLEVGGSAEGSEIDENTHVQIPDQASQSSWWNSLLGKIVVGVVVGLIVLWLAAVFGIG